MVTLRRAIALKYGVPATIPRGTWTCEWRNCMNAVQPGVWNRPIGGGCVGAGAAAATRGSSWRSRR